MRFVYQEVANILRFGAVGIANTLLSYIVIVICLLAGLGDYHSNLFGFIAGIILSYVLNSIWTFRARASMRTALLFKFLAVVIIAYSSNLLLLFIARSFGFIDNPVSHLAGMAVYTPICYAGLRIFVYAPRR